MKKTILTYLRKNRQQVVVIALIATITVSFGIALSSFKSKPTITTPRFERQLFGEWEYKSVIPNTLTSYFKKSDTDVTVRVERNAAALEFSYPFQNTQITDTNNTLIYTSKNLPVETRYTLTSHGIKEELILKKIPQESVFSTTLKTIGATPSIGADGIISFYDAKGVYQFNFERPFVKDSAGSVSYDVKYRLKKVSGEDVKNGTMINGTQVAVPLLATKLAQSSPTISPEGDKYVLYIDVDPGWLHDSKRVLPITIDPTVVHDNSSEFATGQFDRSSNTGTGTTLTSATGGTITTYGNYVVHTFTSNGTFIPNGVGNVEVLVVGGGGGGGETIGGGGGGGGVVYDPDFAVTQQSYPVVVGNGGAGGNGGGYPAGTKGGDSTFSSITAVGGGAGAGYNVAASGTGGSAGGNGAGGGARAGYTAGQGNDGSVQGDTNNAGGGGGATTVAGAASASNGGNGGTGFTSSISGMNVTYGGGGGGGCRNTAYTPGTGGTGGGGAGAEDGSAGTAGTANTGGGGGGGGYRDTGAIEGAGGQGGSGVVIIRYRTQAIGSGFQELTSDQYTVGLWHLNEASGNAVDSSGNGFTGTATGTTVVNGISGNARYFNSISDKIVVADSSTLSPTQKTVEAWVKFSSFGTNQLFLGKGAEEWFTYNGVAWGCAANKIGFMMYNSVPSWVCISSQTTPVAGRWYHIAATYDGAYMQLFVNGVLEAGPTAVSGTVDQGSSFDIGAYTGLINTIPVELDEVRFSNIPRSADEIRASASRSPSASYTSDIIDLTKVTSWNSLTWSESGGRTGDGETLKDTTNLIAHWKLNETSGTTAANSAGTCGVSCNGTLTSFSNTSGRDVVAGSGWTQNYRRWGEGALMFDSTDDFINLGDVTQFDNLTQLTVSAWVRPDANATGSEYNAIIAKADYSAAGNAFFLRNTVSEGVRFAVRDATDHQISCDTGIAPQVGQWNHIVGVLTSDDRCIVYMNGVQLATSSNTAFTGIQNTTTGLKIGSSDYASETYFDGAIDSISIFSRALSASEVLSNYNASDVEFQTRVGNTANPNDGTWEAWKPSTLETTLKSFDTFESTTRAYDSAIGGVTTNQTWKKKNNAIPDASDTISTDGRIPLGTAGKADQSNAMAPTVLYEGGTYKMWYTATDGVNQRTSYATSPDGLTWTKYDNTIPSNSDTTSSGGRIPLGTAGKGDQTNASYVSVIKDGNTYKMWYSGSDGTNWRIYYATSPDGLTWTKYDNTIPSNSDTTSSGGRIPLGTAGKGDDGGTLRPTVIKDGNTYKMWYSGANSGVWRIYYATSPDGLTWTKYDNTIPSVSNTTNSNGRIGLGTYGSADSSHAYEPNVIKDGTMYKMWYNAHSGTVRIAYATSPDGLTWTKYDNTIPVTSDKNGTNGRIPIGTLGDLTHAYSPTVIRVGTTYKLWYSGQNTNWRIYHASMRSLPTEISTDTVVKTEGTASTKIALRPQVDIDTVGLWHLDETGGTGTYIKDASLNSNNGTPTGTTVVNGISGKARSFNGTTDYISAPYLASYDPTNGTTYEFWIKPTETLTANLATTEKYRVLLGNWECSTTKGWHIAYDGTANGRLYTALGNGTSGSTTVVSLPMTLKSGTWYHIAAVIVPNSYSSRLYVNGSDVSSIPTSFGYSASPQNLTIGRQATSECSGNFRSTNAMFDEVKISKGIKTAEEVAESYRMGTSHYLNVSIPTTDLQNKEVIPFSIAADRPGTYLSATLGENKYINYQPDEYTVGLWHLDESNNTYPRSCYALRLSGVTTNGVYTIDPDGDGGNDPIQAYCNMTYDGGGWTMIVKSWYGSGMIGNADAVGTVADATTLKGNAYKLSDISVRNIIGPSNNFDFMVDQNGYNSAYSTGNYEYVVVRNYTGTWTYERAVAASTTTTTFQSYRASDNALAWTGNIICGYDGGTSAAGINCYGGLGVTNNPQGGAGCTINMGTASNVGWYHLFMNQYNDDTYVYICNGAQHSSGQNMNHRFWVRERKPVVAVAKDESGKSHSQETIVATGGTISSANGYTIHKFTSSGTFQVIDGRGTVEALVVGGGGGGGMDMGGGGGGGGFIFNPAYSVTPQSYTVTVGLGGAGAPAAGTNGQPTAHPYSVPAQNGQNSVFGTLTAIGGGYGGSSYYGYAPLSGNPNSGGSGGGASGYSDTTVKAGAAGTAGQGTAGGQGGGQYYSGGGGGAGVAGTASTNIAHGGAGFRSSILGTNYYWAGGGGGAGYSICGGNGGAGGGGGAAVCTTTGGSGLNSGSAGGGGTTGAQTNTPGGNGGANTGGGGGGGSHYNANNKGGDGGSGIVVVRYPNASFLNQRDGQVVSAASVPGKIGKARSFNGTTDYIEVADSPSTRIGSPYFTFDAWIHPTSLAGCSADGGGSCMIANKENSYEFGLSNTGKFHWAVRNTSPGWAWVNTGVVLPANTWSHITLTYDGSFMKTYLNGVLGNSTAATGSIDNTTYRNALRFGARGAPAAATSFFTGLMDEIRMSNTVRTPEEIRQAYEVGSRSHSITIDFAARMDAGNLIADANDLSFTVDATYYGLQEKGGHLYNGDKIIVRENYNGTEYIAQGTVTSVIKSTGAVTVNAWDNGSTFPSGGYTINADVFKWQDEYWNVTSPLNTDVDYTNLLTLRFTNSSEGRTVWIDNLRTRDNHLTNPLNSTIQSSTGYRYFQYRTIFHSGDENVTSGISGVTLDYNLNTAPATPTLNSPTTTSTGVSRTPTLYTTATDPNSDYLRYKIVLCTDSNMTQNCQTFDQTSSQNGWSGQNDQEGTAYASGNQASYTISTPLNYITTYYWKSYAIDPGGINTWSGTQVTPNSFTTIAIEAPTNCKVTRTNNTNVIDWTDNASSENGYAVQRSVNGGGWTDVSMNMNPDSVSYVDSPIQNGTTYQYRIASFLTGPQYSGWCTTALQDIQQGTLKFEGNFNFSGIEVK